MITLYEYGQWHKVEGKDSLKEFLRNVWQQRLGVQNTGHESNEDQDSRYQPFLKFDDHFVRANNYIGFIQNGDELIEIYPKVFRNHEQPDRRQMLQHIFYWFKYCRKWRFPFTEASLDTQDIDRFPELIIYLIARQILETVSAQPFMQYQIVEERMNTVKGAINFNRYICKSFSKGNYHILECDHEPFVYDNKVNRIIKCCTRLLLPQTRMAETQRLLQETIFILDEVEDAPCSIHDFGTVSFNPFFGDYEAVMQLCKTILEQQLYSNQTYDLSQWCLLLPMEYVFEDFVAGFLERHFSDKWEVHYQKSDEYLVSRPSHIFQMQHDIFIVSRSDSKRKVIIDTKYKLRNHQSKDPKKGVSQDDLYQVVSYAYRRGCNEVVLVYPNVGEEKNDVAEFEIDSGFQGKDVIKVSVLEVPFWSMNNFEKLTTQLYAAFQEIKL